MALLKLSPDVRGDLSVILGRVDDGLGMDVEGVEVCGCACAAVSPVVVMSSPCYGTNGGGAAGAVAGISAWCIGSPGHDQGMCCHTPTFAQPVV